MDIFVSSESAFSPMLLRRKNVWYSVNDGNWSDPNTWMSNALDKKAFTSPQNGDDVFIYHNVTIDTIGTLQTLYPLSGFFGFLVGNLTITGNLNISTVISTVGLVVLGELACNGTLDLSANNLNHTLYLAGINTSINTFAPGHSTINYIRAGDQPILPLNYYHLTLSNPWSYFGTKSLSANLSISGNLLVQDTATIETYSYNVTIGGTTTLSGSNTKYPATFSTSGSSSLLFIGRFTVGNNPSAVNLTGNPTIEFRGGLTLKNDAITNNWGSGNMNFTTNNQTTDMASGSLVQIISNPVFIVGAITLTNIGNYIQFNGVINGTVSGSTLNNTGILLFGSTSSQMTTGVFTTNTSGSSIGYYFNGNYTLPYNSYANLIINGTGTKTPSTSATWNNLTVLSGTFALSANTSMNNLTMSGTFSGSKLECSTYNCTFNGTTALSGGNLSKTGAGSLLFVGQLGVNSGTAGLTFTGNPSIELRGGWFVKRDGTYNLGTGTITFTTNNQTVQSENFSYPDSSFKLTFSNNVVISGAITVTYTSAMWIMTGTLNGTVSGSTFDCRGYLQYQNATAPMVTGVFAANNATNYVEYNLNGNQDLTAGNYKNLTLSVGGAKRLLGNISVANTYTLSAPATLNTNGFALTNP